MNTTLRSVLLLLLLSLAGREALATSVRVVAGQPARWPTPAVEWRLQQAAPAAVALEDAVASVRLGAQRWTEPSCTDLVMEETGEAPNPHAALLAGAGSNGVNEVVWLVDDAWTYGASVLGVTAPLTDAEGFISEADIAFNGYLVQWSATGSGGIDIESVAVHEFGHFIGLQHNLGPNQPGQDKATMHPTVLKNNASRSLETDDINGLCFLYPEDVFHCDEQTPCPKIVEDDVQGDEYYAGEFLCDPELAECASFEWYAAGVSNLGQACDQDANCVAGLHCHATPAGGVCTESCLVMGGACPPGFQCEKDPNKKPWAQYGGCVPTDGVIDEPGAGSSGCASAASCPPGEYCLPSPEGDKSICATLCTVGAGGDAECAEGELCYDFGNPTGGCFPAELVEPDGSGETGEVDPEPDAGAQPGPEDAAASPIDTWSGPDDQPEDVGPALEEVSGSGDEGEDAAGEDDPLPVVPGDGGGSGCAGGSPGPSPLLALLAGLVLGWPVRRRRVV